MPPLQPPLVVTVSAAYGTAGSAIGPKVAAALGIPFLDRAIPRQVAERLAIPLAEALRQDETAPARLDRLLAPFAWVGLALAGSPDLGTGAHVGTGTTIAESTEQVIHELAAGTGGVILGRAGAVVLGDRPGTLRVRLTGPVERRVEHAMRAEGVDRETAERRLKETDGARDLYVRHFHNADPHDPSLYQLVIDSTAIDEDAVVAMIVQAARAIAPAAD